MHGDVFLILLLLVFGCAAFLFGVIYVICQMFAWLGRGVWGAFRPHHSACACPPPVGSSRPKVCPNERCRKVEHRHARYCSQCGSSLT